MIISLREPYTYLSESLARLGVDEPDFTTAILQQIAKTVVTLNQRWPDDQSVGEIYDQVVQVSGCHGDTAAAICRYTDDLICHEISRWWPGFASPFYQGHVSYAFISPTDLRIEVSQHLHPPALSAPGGQL